MDWYRKVNPVTGEKISPAPLLKKFGNFNAKLQASALHIDPDLLAKMKDVFGEQIKIENDMIYWNARDDSEK
jgi:hypothetical protein